MEFCVRFCLTIVLIMLPFEVPVTHYLHENAVGNDTATKHNYSSGRNRMKRGQKNDEPYELIRWDTLSSTM